MGRRLGTRAGVEEDWLAERQFSDSGVDLGQLKVQWWTYCWSGFVSPERGLQWVQLSRRRRCKARNSQLTLVRLSSFKDRNRRATPSVLGSIDSFSIVGITTQKTMGQKKDWKKRATQSDAKRMRGKRAVHDVLALLFL